MIVFSPRALDQLVDVGSHRDQVTSSQVVRFRVVGGDVEAGLHGTDTRRHRRAGRNAAQSHGDQGEHADVGAGRVVPLRHPGFRLAGLHDGGLRTIMAGHAHHVVCSKALAQSPRISGAAPQAHQDSCSARQR